MTPDHRARPALQLRSKDDSRIDHIYFERSAAELIAVRRAASADTLRHISKNGLPSARCASDHLPVAALLRAVVPPLPPLSDAERRGDDVAQRAKPAKSAMAACPLEECQLLKLRLLFKQGPAPWSAGRPPPEWIAACGRRCVVALWLVGAGTLPEPSRVPHGSPGGAGLGASERAFGRVLVCPAARSAQSGTATLTMHRKPVRRRRFAGEPSACGAAARLRRERAAEQAASDPRLD